MQLLEVSDTPFHQLMFRSSGRGGQVKKVVLPFYKVWADLPPGLSSFVVTSDLQGRELDRRRNRLVGEVVAEEIADTIPTPIAHCRLVRLFTNRILETTIANALVSIVQADVKTP